MLIKHTRNTAGRGDGTDRASDLTRSVRTLHARTSEQQNTSPSAPQTLLPCQGRTNCTFFNTSGHEKSVEPTKMSQSTVRNNEDGLLFTSNFDPTRTPYFLHSAFISKKYIHLSEKKKNKGRVQRGRVATEGKEGSDL